MCLSKTINETKLFFCVFFFKKSKCQTQLNTPKLEIWTPIRIRLKDSDLTITNYEISAKLDKKPLGLDYKFKKNEVDQENGRSKGQDKY